MIADENKSEFSCFQFNIHGWRDEQNRINTERIRALIRVHNPDFISLNEVKYTFPYGTDESDKLITLLYKNKKHLLRFNSNDNENHMKIKISKALQVPIDSSIKLFTYLLNTEVQINGQIPDQPNPRDDKGKYMVTIREGTQRTEEKPLTQLEELSKELGYHYEFGYALDETFGNVFLSKVRIEGCRNIFLTKVNNFEQRALLEIDLGPAYPVFYVTHLDFKQEETRLEELKSALANIKSDRPHILMGDFNSLNTDDYEVQTLIEIKKTREKNSWQPPLSEVIKMLLSNEYIDCWKRCHPTKKDIYTCTKKTRIDYIWAKNVLKLWDIIQCDIIDTGDVSDHHPVIAKFKKMMK